MKYRPPKLELTTTLTVLCLILAFASLIPALVQNAKYQYPCDSLAPGEMTYLTMKRYVSSNDHELSFLIVRLSELNWAVS